MIFKSRISFFNAFINISIFTLLLWVFFFIFLQIETLSIYVHPYIHEIILYSWIVAIIIAIYSNYILKAGGSSIYVNIILGSTTIRMILSIIILIILLLRTPDKRIILVINFFIVYLSYLLFEIYSIITNLRTFSKKDKNDGA